MSASSSRRKSVRQSIGEMRRGVGEKVQKQVEKIKGPLVDTLMNSLAQTLPASLRKTLQLRTFGFFKIPLLFLISPTVLQLNDDQVEVKIPLNRRTRNHLKTMYFAVLAAGADCACGALAFHWIDRIAKGRVDLIFKDFKADFLKRAEGDVVFSCVQGPLIREAIRLAMETRERQNIPIEVIARVPSELGSEPVARFVLTLSLKYQ